MVRSAFGEMKIVLYMQSPGCADIAVGKSSSYMNRLICYCKIEVIFNCTVLFHTAFITYVQIT